MSQKNNVRRGQRHPQSFPPVYYMPRPPTTADQVDRWTNKRYEISSFWIIGKSPINGIPVASGTEGDLWYLCKYESNGDATWCKFDIVPGGSGLDAIRDQVNAVVDVDGSGYSDIDGSIVATAANPSGIPLETVKSTSTLLLQMQLAGLVSPTPGDTTSVGVASFNDNQFQKDVTSGMISLVGSTVLPPVLFQWVEETTTSRSLNVNEGVIGNNALTITMTLPATAALGDKMCFLQKGAGIIQVAQNAGQTIHSVTASTTTGVGGNVQTINQWTSFCIICVTANTDFAILQAPEGNLVFN